MAGPEAVWQGFFEENPRIFGHGLTLVACGPIDDGGLERITTGANIFAGAGKRSDAGMRSKGFVSSLLFCEIKTHQTRLLAGAPYRVPDVYQVSKDIVGAVAQVHQDRLQSPTTGQRSTAQALPGRRRPDGHRVLHRPPPTGTGDRKPQRVH